MKIYSFKNSLFCDYFDLIQSSNFYKKYFALFKCLDLSGIPDKNYGVGNTGYSRHAFIRALVVKELEQLKTIPDLLRFLDSQPVIAVMCGFDVGCLPDETLFYKFLKKTPNSIFKEIHIRINKSLIKLNAVSLDTFIMDSKPMKANTKENNPKNPGRNLRNKKKKPKRNPYATLSYYSYELIPDSGEKKYQFFWGFRTHVIVSKEGIPLIERTFPNNRTDGEVAFLLIKDLKRTYKFKKDSIYIGDAAYDLRNLYTYIVDKLKCQPFIALNPRNQKEPKTLGPHGCPLCAAGLEMKSNGTWPEGNRMRAKFRCPIKMSKKLAKKFPNGCPTKHPFFVNAPNYGCTQYLDITNDARSKIQRDTKTFKTVYKKRIVVEQYFSRFGDRDVEHLSHFSVRSIKNLITIRHFTMSLVALAAVSLERRDKIRSFKTFAESA